MPEQQSSASYIERAALDELFSQLKGHGYTLVGPTIRDAAIVYDRLDTPDELPIGWSDEQDAGRYRLRKRGDDRVFAYGAGPQSWKKYLYPPELKLWSATRERRGRGLNLSPHPEPDTRYALIGVRACELTALAIQDRVFVHGEYADPHYTLLRQRSFVVAVQCGHAGNTCFCASLRAGPRVAEGYDLALTELRDDTSHGYVVEVGSERGQELLAALTHRDASPDERQAPEQAAEQASASQRRAVELDGLRELLYDNFEHPRWSQVASRCLSCANCTLVCPTCFCSTVEDTTDLAGHEARRVRRWDSCFVRNFSWVAGGSLRPSTRARYRQWLTHKLASWQDQFGTPGCVGCGRCIAWCPAGIDLTEELRVLREQAKPTASTSGTRAGR